MKVTSPKSASRIDTYSIRARLFGRLVPAFVVLALVLFYYLHFHAQRAAERSYDNLLAASALSIADAIQHEDGVPTVELPYSSHAILASRTSSRVFYRVTAPDGTLITGYPGLAADAPPALSPTPTFTSGTFLDVPVRICTLGRYISGGGQSGWVTIVVAETNEEQEQLANELLQVSFGPAVGLMILTTALIWLAVRSALQPLAAIERAITASDPTALKMLDIPAPREIHHLVAALNTMIGRLNMLLSRMQNFIAEAAHQIRTPLFNLRVQVEAAMDEPAGTTMRDRLLIVRRNAVAVSRLADQLLADTMVSHRGEVTSRVPVDLLDLVELIADEFTDRTGVRINLHIGALEAAPYILGDALMLTEAVKNLLDNAMKYGKATETIDVRLHADETRATLSVEDRGPGISSADRETITERFVRGSRDDDIPGSGLGLAIVANVMRHHDAELSFDTREGGGLVVRLVFPRIGAPSEAGP